MPQRVLLLVLVTALFARPDPGIAAPLLTAPIVEYGAPAANPASPYLLDRAESASPLWATLDEGLGDRNGAQALTLSAGATRLAAARLGSGRRWDLLDRTTASLTLGGPTQRPAVHRDGPALDEADHVTTEIKLGLLGSRGPSATAARALAVPPDRFALAMSLSADTYRTGFGKDLYSATLIGELPRPLPLTLNAGLRAEEKVHGIRNDECKLGLGTSRRVVSGRGRFGALDVTAGGGVLLRNRGRRSLWLGGLLVHSQLTPSLTLTAGTIFAERPERTGVHATRGAVGLSYRIE